MVAFVPLEDILASKLNAGVGVVAHKEVTLTIASTTTLADDDDLLWDVLADQVYSLTLYVDYETSDVPDIKFDWGLPSGAAFSWNGQGYSGGSVFQNFGNQSAGTPVVFGGSNVGQPRVARITGSLAMGSVDGRFVFRWAQNVSDAALTTVYQGSWGVLRRIT